MPSVDALDIGEGLIALEHVLEARRAQDVHVGTIKGLEINVALEPGGWRHDDDATILGSRHRLDRRDVGLGRAQCFEPGQVCRLDAHGRASARSVPMVRVS